MMALVHMRLYSSCLVARVVRQCDILPETLQATKGCLLKALMRRQYSLAFHSHVFAFSRMAYVSGCIRENFIAMLIRVRVL